MSIIRTKTDAEFFIMHNATAQDKSLSWEARGMLAYLLSRPPGWKTKVADLVRQSGAGRDKCYRILTELLDAGYIRRVSGRHDGKFGGADYDVYDRPTVVKPEENNTEIAVLPDTVLPDTVLPDTGNPDAYKEHTLERTEPERTEIIYSADFEELWANWQPFDMRKGNRQKAVESWHKNVVNAGVDQWLVVEQAKAYCADCRRTASKTQHIVTWLNQRGWEDDYGPPLSIQEQARMMRQRKRELEDRKALSDG